MWMPALGRIGGRMNTDKIKKHLAEYKINVLGITENGGWWKNHKKYEHILPIEKKYENIINTELKASLISLLESDTIHIGFHHMNSSQALALNLFGPLVLSKKLNKIDNVIISDKSVGKFEYIENTNENTNFDFYISDGDKSNYFEVKYTENNFGEAKSDQEHKQKYIEIYKKDLQSISDISEHEFYKEYQLWRNIIYAKKGNVFFVLPDFRVDLIKKVNDAKTRINNIEVRNRVHLLSINNLVSKCKEILELNNHYCEFEKKYLKIT